MATKVLAAAADAALASVVVELALDVDSVAPDAGRLAPRQADSATIKARVKRAKRLSEYLPDQYVRES